MSGVRATLFGDALLLKELRTRLRSRAGMLMINLYILAMCAYALWVYGIFGEMGEGLASESGTRIFTHVSYIQLAIILVVCPLVTASSITGEKEQKTFDSLSVAPVSPARIAMAKLCSALGYFYALLFLSLPLVSVSFILGGVAPVSIFAAYAVAAAVTLYVGSIGFYWSTRFQRSIAAIPAAAITVAVIALAIPMWLSSSESFASSLSPVSAMGYAQEGALQTFFGLSCPLWLTSAFLSALVGGAFMCAAVVRLHFVPERRYVLARALTFCVIVAVASLVAGGMFPAPLQTGVREAISTFLGLVAAAVIFLAPWIGANLAVTDSDRASRADRCYSLATLALRQTVLSPAWFLTLLLVVVAVLVGSGQALSPPGAQFTSPVPWLVGLLALFFCGQAWIAVAARLTRGRTTRGRWLAIATVYLVAGVLAFVPPVVQAAMTWGGRQAAPLVLQVLLLFSPVNAMSVMYRGQGFLPPPLADIRSALAPLDPTWATAIVYAVILALARFFPRRRSAG